MIAFVSLASVTTYCSHVSKCKEIVLEIWFLSFIKMAAPNKTMFPSCLGAVSLSLGRKERYLSRPRLHVHVWSSLSGIFLWLVDSVEEATPLEQSGDKLTALHVA